MSMLTRSDPTTTITVLSVSPYPEDQAALRAIFSHSRWLLYDAQSCADAASLLQSHIVPVVIGEANLPDGTWRDLLQNSGSLPGAPRLIVTSDCADERLWAEALNLGAYDVLAKPFRASEVFRTVSLAWRHWKDSSSRCQRAMMAAAS
jgi:response regulator RpfG family c-di-GMP phosphodiesterase